MAEEKRKVAEEKDSEEEDEVQRIESCVQCWRSKIQKRCCPMAKAEKREGEIGVTLLISARKKGWQLQSVCEGEGGCAPDGRARVREVWSIKRCLRTRLDVGIVSAKLDVGRSRFEIGRAHV